MAMARRKKSKLAPKISAVTSELRSALGDACRSSTPPDVIEWLERTRWLSPESSREVGPIQFQKAPYQIEAQRAAVDSEISEVVLDWSSQSGKSEILINSILYWSVFSPGPCLVITPDWKSAKSFSCDRIQPAFRDAKISAEIDDADPPKKGGPGADWSCFRLTVGNGMPVTIVPASTASGLSMRPIKYLVGDELSRWPLSAKGRTAEGDPLALARVRLTAFGSEAKIVLASSPVERGQCRITQLYESSSCERYHLRCLKCGHLQILKLDQMNFHGATCRCLQCGAELTQDEWQSEVGQWIAEFPQSSRRGFWMSAFSSPFLRWQTIFGEWEEAEKRRQEGDVSLHKVVLSTRLAECYSEEVQKMSTVEILLARREDYPAEVPSDDVKLLVGAVDTHDRWLELLVMGAGPRGELWLLWTDSVNGRIESESERMLVDLEKRLLTRLWRRPDGRYMKVGRVLWDSGGHHTREIYRLCSRSMILQPYKGAHDLGQPWKYGADSVTHTRLVLGSADYYKNLLASKVAIETAGPGYVHFGNEEAGFNQEFFEQLLSEKKELGKRMGLVVTRWVATRQRNEGLDLTVMCMCAVETCRRQLDTMEPQIVTTDKEQASASSHNGVKWGARKMLMNDLDIGGITGFGMANQPQSPGWGALPGSGVSF
jgi:phage terminase large subunit GpA-like protein